MMLTGLSALDGLTGGLQEQKNYLMYGDVGVGKSTFAFQFLYRGLLAGETVGLVTRRSAQTVFDQGHAFGLDLEGFAHSGQLILFEYLPHVVENCLRLRDERQIGLELLGLLDGDPVSRLVFDPVSSLLSSPTASGAIFRARALVQSFAELQATVLYLFDTPEGAEYLASCKDFVFGVFRFEAVAGAGGRSRLVLERLPGPKGRPTQIDFEATPGVGLVEVSASGGGDPAAHRRVLVVASDRAERQTFRALLEKSYTVVEAEDGADGLAKVAASPPDLVLMSRENPGVDGVELCRRLRQNKINVPIVLVADPIRRAHDRVGVMSAGADECLERPVDGRILKLKIQHLLSRYDGSTDRFAAGGLDAGVTTSFERDKTTTTTNLAYLFDRIRGEAQYATENALSFAVLVLHLPPDHPPGDELLTVAGALIREYDLTFIGRQFIAILLAETDDRGVTVFLKRFAESWTGTPSPTVQYRVFDRTPESVEAARELVAAAAEAAPPPASGPASARPAGHA